MPHHVDPHGVTWNGQTVKRIVVDTYPDSGQPRITLHDLLDQQLLATVNAPTYPLPAGMALIKSRDEHEALADYLCRLALIGPSTASLRSSPSIYHTHIEICPLLLAIPPQ